MISGVTCTTSSSIMIVKSLQIQASLQTFKLSEAKSVWFFVSFYALCRPVCIMNHAGDCPMFVIVSTTPISFYKSQETCNVTWAVCFYIWYLDGLICPVCRPLCRKAIITISILSWYKTRFSFVTVAISLQTKGKYTMITNPPIAPLRSLPTPNMDYGVHFWKS